MARGRSIRSTTRLTSRIAMSVCCGSDIGPRETAGALRGRDSRVRRDLSERTAPHRDREQRAEQQDRIDAESPLPLPVDVAERKPQGDSDKFLASLLPKGVVAGWSHHLPSSLSPIRPARCSSDQTVSRRPLWRASPTAAAGWSRHSWARSAVGARAALLLLLLQGGTHACGLPTPGSGFVGGHHGLPSVGRESFRVR